MSLYFLELFSANLSYFLFIALAETFTFCAFDFSFFSQSSHSPVDWEGVFIAEKGVMPK
jgi:hypothetical protein